MKKNLTKNTRRKQGVEESIGVLTGTKCTLKKAKNPVEELLVIFVPR